MSKHLQSLATAAARGGEGDDAVAVLVEVSLRERKSQGCSFSTARLAGLSWSGKYSDLLEVLVQSLVVAHWMNS